MDLNDAYDGFISNYGGNLRDNIADTTDGYVVSGLS
jgi:hypothetical protein